MDFELKLPIRRKGSRLVAMADFNKWAAAGAAGIKSLFKPKGEVLTEFIEEVWLLRFAISRFLMMDSCRSTPSMKRICHIR